MSLSSGARVGPYEIQAAVEAGGMGEAYRATDTNLGRRVAHIAGATATRLPSGNRRGLAYARGMAGISEPGQVADLAGAVPMSWRCGFVRRRPRSPE
jgi:hypothetical protein